MGWKDDIKEPEGPSDSRGTEMQINMGEGDGAADRREGAEDGQSLTVQGGGAEGEEATPEKEKAE